MPQILIVGASRGIGLGLAEEFARRGWAVVATRRNGAAPLEALAQRSDKVRLERVDIADAASAEALRDRLEGETFDAIVVNAGVGGPPANPRTVSREALADLFVTNAQGPIRLAELLVKSVKPGSGVVGLMTSQLGSIANNETGGTELYRASKAALNSFTRSFAARHRDKGLAVLSLHPGWVRTDMGGPNAAIDVAESARGLADVIERAVGDRRSGFFDWRGQEVPW